MTYRPTDDQIDAAARVLSPEAFDPAAFVFLSFGQSIEKARANAQEYARKRARTALEAAGPLIAAQALRDAAERITMPVEVARTLHHRADTLTKET